MLYIISPLLTYFITGSLYLLSPFAQFCPPSTPPGSHREEAVSSQYLSQVFVFQIPHISETIWCLSFFDLLHLFSIKYFYLTAFGAGICFQPRKIRIKKKKITSQGYRTHTMATGAKWPQGYFWANHQLRIKNVLRSPQRSMYVQFLNILQFTGCFSLIRSY